MCAKFTINKCNNTNRAKKQQQITRAETVVNELE